MCGSQVTRLPKSQTAVFGFISVDEIIIVILFVFVMSLSSGLSQVKREDGIATKVCCPQLNQRLSAVFWFGTGFLLTGRRKTLVIKKQCVDCLFKLV